MIIRLSLFKNLFSAMSSFDHAKMKSLVTTDFQLLEAGEDWDIDDLINVINPSEYKRRNYFNVINTKNQRTSCMG